MGNNEVLSRNRRHNKEPHRNCIVNNSITKIKNSMDWPDSRMEGTERISKLEDETIEATRVNKKR